MDAAQLVLVIVGTIGAIAGLITALGGVIINAHRLDELQKQVDDERKQRIDLQDKQETARRDIIQIGEQLHFARLDNACIAEAFNQLFVEFRDVTGHRPAVNLERLKHMQTIQYITGPLEGGPLQVKD